MLIIRKKFACGEGLNLRVLMGDVPAVAAFDFWDMGLTAHAVRGLEFYDCIEHKRIGIKKEVFSETVAAHGSKVYRCRVVS